MGVRVTWEPEALPADADEALPAPVKPASPDIVLPPLSDIVARVQVEGHFPASLIARLHAGLWSHPRRHFAILTGLSGSGKTLLAREYAKAIANGGSEARLFTLPVQPGWHDPGALLGFVNPLRGDSYVRTPFLEFLLSAAANPTEPHVAVLDEMNLSHPEQYMAPLLSAMETGDAVHLHTEDAVFDGVPASVPYPANLVLIGTVNMDETTHGLSDKVLDRAFVLEFWEIDLHAYPRWTTRQMDEAQVQRVRDLLAGLMSALAPVRLHFGWRVVDEVLDFMTHAAGAGDTLSFDAALDAVIFAKVLPKLRGEDGPRLREALAQCDQVLQAFNLHTCSAKLADLRRDVETTGSMRFWR